MRIWTDSLAANPFKVIFYTLEYLFCLALAIFTFKPFMGQGCTLAEITLTTQTYHVYGDSAGAFGVNNWNPMVSVWHNFPKKVAQLITTYSAAVIEVFQAGLPILRCKSIRKISYPRPASQFMNAFFVGVIIFPPTIAFGYFIAVGWIGSVITFTILFTTMFRVSRVRLSALLQYFLVISFVILFLILNHIVTMRLIPFFVIGIFALFACIIQTVSIGFHLIKILSSCREGLAALYTYFCGIIGIHNFDSFIVEEPLGADTPRTASFVSPILAQMFYIENLFLEEWV